MKTENQQKPVETVLERPDLYCAVHLPAYQILTGVFLKKGRGKVLVREILEPVIPGFVKTQVGEYIPEPPAGPKYTGPIDDEMMANILMFGG